MKIFPTEESCQTGENEFSEKNKTCMPQKPPHCQELPDWEK